jgi:hypothetical protein
MRQKVPEHDTVLIFDRIAKPMSGGERVGCLTMARDSDVANVVT